MADEFEGVELLYGKILSSRRTRNYARSDIGNNSKYDSLSGLVYDVMTMSEKNDTAFPSAHLVILLVIPSTESVGGSPNQFYSINE